MCLDVWTPGKLVLFKNKHPKGHSFLQKWFFSEFWRKQEDKLGISVNLTMRNTCVGLFVGFASHFSPSFLLHFQWTAPWAEKPAADSPYPTRCAHGGTWTGSYVVAVRTEVCPTAHLLWVLSSFFLAHAAWGTLYAKSCFPWFNPTAMTNLCKLGCAMVHD